MNSPKKGVSGFSPLEERAKKRTYFGESLSIIPLLLLLLLRRRRHYRVPLKVGNLRRMTQLAKSSRPPAPVGQREWCGAIAKGALMR